jgi:hypothetical protein
MTRAILHKRKNYKAHKLKTGNMVAEPEGST